MARRRSYSQDVTAAQKKRFAHPEYLTLDPIRGSYSKEELLAARRALAKAANQRLVRLETTYSKVTDESYADFGAAEIVEEYLRTTRKAGSKSKSGKRRFSESPNYLKDDDTALRMEIYTLQSFLSSKSSTVKGQKTAEQKRIETFEGKGIHFSSNKQFYDFLNSSTFKELKKDFDSNKIVELWDAAKMKDKRKSKSITQKMQEALDEWKKEDSNKQPSLKDLARRLGVNILKQSG